MPSAASSNTSANEPSSDNNSPSASGKPVRRVTAEQKRLLQAKAAQKKKQQQQQQESRGSTPRKSAQCDEGVETATAAMELNVFTPASRGSRDKGHTSMPLQDMSRLTRSQSSSPTRKSAEARAEIVSASSHAHVDPSQPGATAAGRPHSYSTPEQDVHKLPVATGSNVPLRRRNMSGESASLKAADAPVVSQLSQHQDKRQAGSGAKQSSSGASAPMPQLLPSSDTLQGMSMPVVMSQV